MLSNTNVLLRGCQLRNTEWVLGLVLSTGIDTKINFCEEASAAVKPNHTMAMVNTHTSFLVFLLAAICLGGSFANLGFVHGFGQRGWDESGGVVDGGKGDDWMSGGKGSDTKTSC